MRTALPALCDECREIIPEPRQGVIGGVRIIGNIYTASASHQPQGGLIGRSSPGADNTVSDVTLCWLCFLRALGWGDSSPSGTVSRAAAAKIINEVFPVSASTE